MLRSGSAAAFAALLLLISLSGPAMARRHLHRKLLAHRRAAVACWYTRPQLHRGVV
jgi:hypothetical protein